jgi:hypothetical protein
MKIEAVLETCSYIVTLSRDEAMTLYEALLQAKRKKWTEGECDDIKVVIEEDEY